MSLMKVRHGLSPLVEKSLIALAGCVGLMAIYFAQVRPFPTAVAWPARLVPSPVPLDLDGWTWARNATYGYDYAVPPGWLVDDSDSDRLVIGSGYGALAAGLTGTALTIEVRSLDERQETENLVAGDFSGLRYARYDVGVAGYPGIFAVAFERGRPARQAVYVARGQTVLVVRGDWMDPAAFSAFVSGLRFFK